jgi:uncharacterized protein (TIGR01777 family)
MKICIPGGSGQIGQMLARRFTARGDQVVILCRGGQPRAGRGVVWDGINPGPWTAEIDGADVVINLAGRSVNCRYTSENQRQIMDSRVLSTRAIGRAVADASKPPAVWLQASTATIYRHTFGEPNDDLTGTLGGNEPAAPPKWNFSIDVAKACEAAAMEPDLPATRRVLLRSALTLSTDRGGIFDVLLGLVRRGLGGTCGSGRQFVSWIHGDDFLRAIDVLIANPQLDGPVNLTSPNPLPNADFMRGLRRAWGAKIGLPAMAWMLEIGAVLMRSEAELILKSRRVVPRRLTDAGFKFEFPDWPAAAVDLCQRWRAENGKPA